MRRGDVVTISGGPDYAGKPRPAVIVQDDRFPRTNSVTVCPFTSQQTEAPLMRLVIEPEPGNGLSTASRLMIDKITTVPLGKIGGRIGRLQDADLIKLDAALRMFLGLSERARPAQRSLKP